MKEEKKMFTLDSEKEANKIKLYNKEKLLISILMGAIRNSSYFEYLHRGITPSTKSGDYTDVKVVTPYGEINWSELSRISDAEMGVLKDSFRVALIQEVKRLKYFGLSFTIEKDSELDKFMRQHIPNEFARKIFNANK